MPGYLQLIVVHKSEQNWETSIDKVHNHKDAVVMSDIVSR